MFPLPRDFKSDVTLLYGYYIIIEMKQEIIPELRNTLSSTDSPDTAPEILLFSDLLSFYI
jgi:hypothetical protein